MRDLLVIIYFSHFPIDGMLLAWNYSVNISTANDKINCITCSTSSDGFPLVQAMLHRWFQMHISSTVFQIKEKNSITLKKKIKLQFCGKYSRVYSSLRTPILISESKEQIIIVLPSFFAAITSNYINNLILHYHLDYNCLTSVTLQDCIDWNLMLKKNWFICLARIPSSNGRHKHKLSYSHNLMTVLGK